MPTKTKSAIRTNSPKSPWQLSRNALLILALGLAPLAANAAATDNSDPVLDLLLKKGLITEDDASKVRATLAERATNADTSRWLVNKGVKDMELFGDARLRYEGRTAWDPTAGKIDLERLRYALRFGVRGDLFDDFYYGFRLDTAANPRSPWVTMGTSSSSSPPYQGPFGKSAAGIGVGQVYLGWHPEDWVNVTLGKMPQPLYTTPMVWDSDFCPEGAFEKFTYKAGAAEFFANFGQFIYEDTNPTQAGQGYFGLNSVYPTGHGGSSSPLFMLTWQTGFKYRFDTNMSFTLAPVLYNYTSHGGNTSRSASMVQPGFSDTFVGQGAKTGINGITASGWSGYPSGFEDGFNANQTGLNDLMILEVPWQFDFKLGCLDARVFGDYAMNLDGRRRAEAAYAASQTLPGPESGGVTPISSAQTHDNKAGQVGVAIGNAGSLGLVYGSVSRRHGWEFRTYWQHIEQYALDPNLIDSDFFEGAMNLQGVYAAFAYGFSDNFIGTIRYGHATRINDKLGTASSNQDIAQMNPIQHYQIIQLDLTAKF